MRRIDKVKAHPLLSPPPPEERWWRMTDEDRGAILSRLRRAGGEEHPAVFLKMHHLLRELGHPQEITLDDQIHLSMSSTLERKSRRGDETARICYHLKKLELHSGPTDLEAMQIRAWLRKLRGPEGEDNPDRGADTAELIANMKDIGMEEPVTAEDRAIIDETLSRYKKIADGFGIARLTYNIRRLGIRADWADEDMPLIQKNLEEYRRAGDGEKIAETLLYIKDIKPPRGTSETPPVPPIKEYGKR